MKTKVKYTQNRKYRDFVDDEIQEEILKGIKKDKVKSLVRKGVSKFLSFLKG